MNDRAEKIEQHAKAIADAMRLYQSAYSDDIKNRMVSAAKSALKDLNKDFNTLPKPYKPTTVWWTATVGGEEIAPRELIEVQMWGDNGEIRIDLPKGTFKQWEVPEGKKGGAIVGFFADASSPEPMITLRCGYALGGNVISVKSIESEARRFGSIVTRRIDSDPCR